jgi:predicted AAA+ superfamily ATPase
MKPLCEKIRSIPLTIDMPEYNESHDELMSLFYEYLLHGGYLPAINEYIMEKTISVGTMNTYIHWIIGDILKYNKNENYLFEILRGIKATYNTQISWNSLSRFLPIEHHKTISEYCDILVNIHVLNIQQAIIEHKLIGAPKKNRKIYFRDPFIDHSVTNYLDSKFSFERLNNSLKKNEFTAQYVEAITVEHCKRLTPTYYIKGKKGEVDVAMVLENKMHPVEIKWSDRIHKEDIKQILNYRNGLILTPKAEIKKIDHNYLIPLIRFLIHISGNQFIFAE